MEYILRNSSAILFGVNYAGVICAACSFIRQSEEKQSVFHYTAGTHFIFYMNQMALTQLKFRAFPYHLGLQLLNDIGCSMSVLPMYALWAKNDYHHYFDKVDGPESSSKKNKEKSVDGVKIMTAEDMSDEKDGERSIQDVLSSIEVKRAKLR